MHAEGASLDQGVRFKDLIILLLRMKLGSELLAGDELRVAGCPRSRDKLEECESLLLL
jgi:hypothetical protein